MFQQWTFSVLLELHLRPEEEQEEEEELTRQRVAIQSLSEKKFAKTTEIIWIADIMKGAVFFSIIVTQWC